MKTKTKLITLLASVTLLTACGNTQKPCECFTNEKDPKTEQTTQSTETSKSTETTETTQQTEQTTQSTETTQTTETTEPSTEQEQAKVGTTPALQPTFEIKHIGMGHDEYGTLIDIYTVIHRPTGDKVYKAMNEEQAKAFCNYMEEIAHGKEKLDYSMTQNFEYWLQTIDIYQ